MRWLSARPGGGGPRVHGHDPAIQPYRAAHGAGERAARQRLRLHELQVVGLRIGQGLAVAVEGRAGHAGGLEGLQPVGGRLAREVRVQQVLQFGLVLRAQRWRCKAVVLQQLRHPHHGAHLLPQAVVAGGDDEPAFTGRVGLVGRVARVRRPELARVASGAEELAGLQGRDAQRRAEHRHIDMPPRATGPHPGQHRGDGERRVQAGGKVGQRHPGLDGGPTGFAGHAHHAGRGLDGDVEAAFCAPRAVLPEGGDGAVHQRRLARREPVPAQAQALHRTRAVVFHQHISLQGQAACQGEALGVLQVQCNGLLAPVQAGEVLAVARRQGRPGAHGVAFRGFDLHHLRAIVGQQHAREGAGSDLAELHHLHAGQRPGVRRVRRARHRWRAGRPCAGG